MEREFVIETGSRPVRVNMGQMAGKEHSTGATVAEEEAERRVMEERPEAAHQLRRL